MDDRCSKQKRLIACEIFRVETQKNFLSKRSTKINTREYYRPFEEWYTEDKETFVLALTELKNISDTEYESLFAENAERKELLREKFLSHIIRLSVYFNIAVESVPSLLKELIYSAVSNMGEHSWTGNVLAVGAYNSLSGLLMSMIGASGGEPTQLFFAETRNLKPLFKDFISLEEVTTLEIASVYQTLYEAGVVCKYPAYLKQAFDAMYMYDLHLVSYSAWVEYIYKYSLKKIGKDIALLKMVGFEKTPVLLEAIVEDVKAKLLADSQNKRAYCAKLVAKHQKSILQVIKNEDAGKVISQFLRSSCSKI